MFEIGEPGRSFVISTLQGVFHGENDKDRHKDKCEKKRDSVGSFVISTLRQIFLLWEFKLNNITF